MFDRKVSLGETADPLVDYGPHLPGGYCLHEKINAVRVLSGFETQGRELFSLFAKSRVAIFGNLRLFPYLCVPGINVLNNHSPGAHRWLVHQASVQSLVLPLCIDNVVAKGKQGDKNRGKFVLCGFSESSRRENSLKHGKPSDWTMEC